VLPESILGLTFTRNAAEEMRQRLIPVLGEMASRVIGKSCRNWMASDMTLTQKSNAVWTMNSCH